jgi:hypothetical protein
MITHNFETFDELVTFLTEQKEQGSSAIEVVTGNAMHAKVIALHLFSAGYEHIKAGSETNRFIVNI